MSEAGNLERNRVDSLFLPHVKGWTCALLGALWARAQVLPSDAVKSQRVGLTQLIASSSCGSNFDTCGRPPYALIFRCLSFLNPATRSSFTTYEQTNLRPTNPSAVFAPTRPRSTVIVMPSGASAPARAGNSLPDLLCFTPKQHWT